MNNELQSQKVSPEVGITSADTAKIPWNLVTKNLAGHELLRKKIREKISKLETHLKHFPTGAMHLHITLERHPRKTLFSSALTLRVPSNILHSRKTAPDVIKAFDDSVRALLRELETLKARLRSETLWKRKVRRNKLRRETKGQEFAFEPQLQGEGPRGERDVVAELLKEQYQTLIRHARRAVRLAELSGDAPDGTIDPRGIVDDVVRKVMTGWWFKPERSDWTIWLHQLIRKELQARCKNVGENVSLSLEEDVMAPELQEAVEGYDPEQPLDIIANELEPFIVQLHDLIPDKTSIPPDETVAARDLMDFLQKQTQSWSRQERDIFHFHFLDGFEADEVAMLVEQPVEKVRQSIRELHERIRGLLVFEASLQRV